MSGVNRHPRLPRPRPEPPKRHDFFAVVIALALIIIGSLAIYDRVEPQPDETEMAGVADIHDYPWWPRLYYPPEGGDVLTVQVNAGPNSWRIRRIAKAMDAQVEGISVRTSGDCTEVDLCVRVVVGLFDEQTQRDLIGADVLWNGLTTYPSERERVIYLNQWTPKWRHSLTAAHELGHVFGLDHHQSRGVTSIAGREMRQLHPSEIAVLNQHYGVTS